MVFVTFDMPLASTVSAVHTVGNCWSLLLQRPNQDVRLLHLKPQNSSFESCLFSSRDLLRQPLLFLTVFLPCFKSCHVTTDTDQSVGLSSGVLSVVPALSTQAQHFLTPVSLTAWSRFSPQKKKKSRVLFLFL